MSDAEHQGAGETGQAGVPVSRYEVVPAAAKSDDADLYSFRAEIPPPPQPIAPARPPIVALAQDSSMLMYLAFGGLILAAIGMIAYFTLHQDEPQAYIDLGTKGIDASGLEGRAVVKWAGHALYEIHLDPIAPRQLDGFSAVAQNPPRPLSVDIKLKNASGAVVCQKEILFPYDPGGDPSHKLLQQTTSDGDTIQNVAAADGRVAEIVVSGNLPCPAKLYRKVDSWEFASNFPLLADQADWLRHQQDIVADERRRSAEAKARALIPKGRQLSAPIEGDDVIVSDNPSKGSVETRAGRVFYIGRDGLLGRAGWQIFPASIHFRCDTKGSCVLTRTDASLPLEARLVR